MRRKTTVVLVAGLACTLSGPATALAPAHEIGGFSTYATATPLKIEIYEPTIPVPAEPQLELSLSYAHVEASSGPSAKARSSALWPGSPVGEGLKTIGDQLGLPAQLTAGGYPVQVNADLQSGPKNQAQEPLPGMVMRADTGDTRTAAKAGYSSSGDLAEDQDEPTTAQDPPSAPTLPALPGLSGLTTIDPNALLAALSKGDLGGLGAALTGSTDVAPPAAGVAGEKSEAASAPNPLGALGALVSVGGASAVTSTDYPAGKGVVAKATSRLGGISLLAGLVSLDGVKVTTTTTSDLSGAKSDYKASFVGLRIAGQSFSLTQDGIEAAGKTLPIPGLPDDPAKALAALGITIELPTARVTDEGVHSAVDMRGLTITIDSKPLLSRLPKLPLDQLVGFLPEEAAQVKSLLGALATATPKVVIRIGNASTEATTIPAVDFGSPGGGQGDAPGDSPAGGGGGAGGETTTSSPPIPVVAAPVGTTTGAVSAAPITTAVVPASSTPGLPPLGSVPGALLCAGLLLGAGAGWGLRRAGLLVLGGADRCAHGYSAGLPDLRKV